MWNLWEYLGAGSWTTKLLLHLNWDATDSSGNWNNWVSTNIIWTWGKVWSWSASFNWTTSNIATLSWLNIPITNYTINVWIKPTSIPTWNDFWEILWVFNSSAQYIVWLMLYQQKYYALQWVWWANWLIQPTSPIPTAWATEMLTVVWSTTAITLYRNWVQIWTAWSWSFSWVINYIKIWNWKYIWLIDEIIIENRNWTIDEIKKQYTYQKWRFIL